MISKTVFNKLEKVLLFILGARRMRLLYAGWVLVKEKYSPIDPKWFLEFRDYYEKGRNKMTIYEFHVLYTLYRLEAAKAWALRSRETEEEIRSFYSEEQTRFHLFRHAFRHRLSSYYEIMKYCTKRALICEYGCGIAPITHFLILRLPKARFTLVDIESHMFDFAKHRFAKHPNVEFKTPGIGDNYPLLERYDIITCDDVLEHVPNPLTLCQHFYEHLKPEGKLFVNFVYAPGDENLTSSAKRRDKTIDFLNENFKAIRPLRKEDPTGQDAIFVKSK